ncbi:MAG: hypothetical protein CME64_03520 [Halobacteriovoraceae bacterium]|nr:hypothetical protein [Halobacteriovoraceae bacterium]|tara:strand:+ start:26060 stop:26926 length:867 start_codon:yes stop_codon:yes gene_type:complete
MKNFKVLIFILSALLVSCEEKAAKVAEALDGPSEQLTPLSIATSALSQAKVGESFEAMLSSQGGAVPYAYSTIDSLPSGMMLTTDGTLTGTPSEVFNATITVTVTDAENTTTQKSFTLEVLPPDGVERCAVVVDFDSAGSTLPDTRFDTIFSDVYTDVYQDGITTVIGSHENYNHAGISGSGFNLYAGDIIRLVWKNVSSVNSHTFSPRISFIETGRFTTSNSANWLLSSSLTLNPGESGVSEYTITSFTSSNSFNVNQNINQGKQLLLDRIEFVESARATNEVCVID